MAAESHFLEPAGARCPVAGAVGRGRGAEAGHRQQGERAWGLLQPTGHGRTRSQTGVLSASQGKRQGEKGRLQKIKTIIIIKAGRSGFHLQLNMLHASSLKKRPIKCGRPEKRGRRRKGSGEQGKGEREARKVMGNEGEEEAG